MPICLDKINLFFILLSFYCIRPVSETTNCFIGNDLLPNKEFPIIFEKVTGDNEMLGSSWINETEIAVVMKYIERISGNCWNGTIIQSSDIGVVTPYRQQANSIKLSCHNKGYTGISVGTAEIFQGQEFPVVIISTVRSDALGFVQDARVNLFSLINFFSSS